MPFQQLVVDVEAVRSAVAELALRSAGALAVTFGESPVARAPVLEPGPGEMPLWSTVRLVGLFDARTDIITARTMLMAALGPPPPDYVVAEVLEDRAWEREWLRDFRPLRFGRRLWICPTTGAGPAGAAVVVRLDPGLAFGTGTHPTTAQCLQWLDAEVAGGERVLDYGCGSGVLGIAAARLGARDVVCIDHDPQAVQATMANALRNGVADRVRAGARRPDTATFDLVLANILAQPLIELAPELAACARPGGRIVLCGLLDPQRSAVTRAYEPWFDIVAATLRDGWVALTGKRRNG